MTKRRTEITIETHSLTIIRMRVARDDFVYCQNCRAKAVVFSPLDASLIFKVERLELDRLYQEGLIHFGLPDALCGNSLTDHFNHEDTHFIEDYKFRENKNNEKINFNCRKEKAVD